MIMSILLCAAGLLIAVAGFSGPTSIHEGIAVLGVIVFALGVVVWHLARLRAALVPERDAPVRGRYDPIRARFHREPISPSTGRDPETAKIDREAAYR